MILVGLATSTSRLTASSIFSWGTVRPTRIEVPVSFEGHTDVGHTDDESTPLRRLPSVCTELQHPAFLFLAQWTLIERLRKRSKTR